MSRHPLVLAIVAIATISMAQSPPLRGAITGVAVDGSSGVVVADAVVTLTAQAGTTLPAGYVARQMTDAKGRFAFLNLPNDGTFQVSAAKYGYLDGGYGRDGDPGAPLRTVAVEGGSWAANLRVMLWRPATISGTVRDEQGEPVVGVFVRALARVRVAGRDDLAAGPVTVTDDHGRYRLSGLLRGRYLVQVPSVATAVPAGTRVNAPSTDAPAGAIDVDDSTRLVIGRYPLPPPGVNGRAMTYAPSFHPGASAAAEATLIDVTFGDDRAGIDVALAPVAGVRVSGKVEGPAEALATLTLRLMPQGLEQTGIGGDAAIASVAANGDFTFLNVPSGTYTLDAPLTFNELSIRSGATMTGGTVGSGGGASLPSPPRSSGASRMSQETGSAPGVSLSVADYRGASGAKVPGFTGRMPMTVGGADVTGVVLRLRATAVLRGRLLLETDPAKPPPAPMPRFNVFLDPVGGHAGLGQPRMLAPQGNSVEFEITGIPPAEYFLRVQAGGVPWQVKSIQWQDRDHTTTPLDAAATDDLSGVVVTVTNAVASLTGAVRDQRGAVPESGIVVVFPVQPAWRTSTGLWPTRLAAATLSSTGTYRFTSLPAGEYFVAAIDAARLSTWRNPELMTALERSAQRVTLAWGQTTARDLTMTVLK